MRKFASRFFLFALVFTAIPSVANAQFDKRPSCVVMPGNRVKEKFFADYKGERIHFCCRSCAKRFKKNPEKYWAKLQQGAGL